MLSPDLGERTLTAAPTDFLTQQVPVDGGEIDRQDGVGAILGGAVLATGKCVE